MVNSSNIKKLENKYHEILANLSEEELKQYIQVLARNYYISFLINDKELHNNTIKQLEETISVFKVNYNELNNYINFCLLNAINKILNERLSSGITLEVIATSEEDFFSAQPFKSLIDSLNESRKLYFNDVEAKRRIEELERRLAKYEGVKSDG